MKRIMICLVLVLLFIGAANPQTKTMTGTVIDTKQGMYAWAGIVIKVGSKKYFIYTVSGVANPKIVGVVDEVGRRVQVFYTKIIPSSLGYDDDVIATKIVEVKGSGMSQSRHSGTPSSTKQIASKIPSELMEQIINENSDLRVRDVINGAYNGSVAEYIRDWKVERIDLNKDGIPDFIIYPLSPFSGNHVGTVLIYQKTSTGYRNLAKDNLTWSLDHLTKIVMGSSYTNGFVDLYEIEGRKKSKIIFNGRYYQYKT